MTALLQTILLRRLVLDITPADGKTPPKEFRLFPLGDVATSKGTFKFDLDGGASCIAAFKQQGNELPIDYEHQSVQDPPIKAPAAGWFTPELRSDGLWATSVRWTPEATKHLTDGEYRYFSPAFDVDADGRIVSLVNCALTNLPATKDMTPLVTCKAVPFAKGEVVDGEWDADGAEQRMRKLASKDGSGDKDQMDWSKYAMGFLKVDNEGKHFGDYSYPHHDVRANKLVVHKRGVMAAAGALDGARGAKVPKDEIDELRAHLAGHYAQWGAKAPWENSTKEETKMKTLLTALSLKDDATEVEAFVTLTNRLGFEREILSLAGKTTMAEALGVLSAFKVSAAKVTELSAELEKIKTEKTEAEIIGMVDAAIKAGKITPAQRDTTLAMGRTNAVTLKSFLDAMPAGSKGGSEQTPPAGEEITLSAEELVLCKAMGTTPEKYKEYKAKKLKAA